MYGRRLYVLRWVFQLWRQSSDQLLPRRWLLVVFDWTTEKCNSYRNCKIPVRPLNVDCLIWYAYVIIHFVFYFLECIKIGESQRHCPFLVARPHLSPDPLTHPQQDQRIIQKQLGLHIIKEQPRGRHITARLRKEAEALEMMMASTTLVMTMMIAGTLENDRVMVDL